MESKEQIHTYLKEIAANDNRNAFRRFYDSYYTRLFRQALFYLNNNPDYAQEVVTDVFISLWQGRKVLSTVKNPDAYLFVALKHASFAYIAKNHQRDRELLMEHLPETDYNLGESTDASMVNAELEEKYQEALSKLPPRCAEVFRLVREERKKYSEVAEMLGISPKTVENQMGKAIKILHNELRENLFSVFF